ncbi:hypothetical protein [Streptomyces sp. 11-1-2]|uniref:hypothetical protein n=1 Tax=unclassified Streptomyces TaxID=2593676 RepID=UPI000B8D8DB4|nr:hypothetical protein [Streptomyces sp. 11-1-2]ASQ95205.1 hypothetical protein CGL27_20925 [Streptomyces sp. 11-1-2]
MTEDERTEQERIAELRKPGRKWVFGQLQGWNCALCATRLYADRPICTVEVDYGGVIETCQLYVCAPSCEAARQALRPATPDGGLPPIRAPRQRTAT